MQGKTLVSIIVVAVVVLAGMSSIYIIDETERALRLQFGKVQRDSEGLPVVYGPGIHWKIPFADKIYRLDARIQTMDAKPDVFNTSNQQFLEVDTYVQWRVVDFAEFYLRTNGIVREAESRLERLVDNGLRNQFGQRTLKEAISGQRAELMQQIRQQVNDRVPEYGIEVVDIRVKKVNYTSRVIQQVYEQIKSERKAKATEIRSKGQQKANIVKAETDADVQRILAEADEYARTVKGEADATAAEIYANSYNQDPEFYSFIRSLDAYTSSFSDKDDVLVLKPDSEFFKYLTSSTGDKK